MLTKLIRYELICLEELMKVQNPWYTCMIAQINRKMEKSGMLHRAVYRHLNRILWEITVVFKNCDFAP